jgi:hypothetical protein
MPNARGRNRRPGRRKPFREVRSLILVVCEGEKTEKQYLLGFERACRNSRVKVEVTHKCGKPKNLVELAKRLEACAEADNDVGRNPTTGVYKLTERIRG